MSRFLPNADTRWKTTYLSNGVHLLSISACLIWLLQRGHGLTFFFDEWNFILDRTYSAEDLLKPHNGHLSLIPVFVYNVTRSIFGLTSYVPFQIAGLLVHGSVCGAVYVIAKRRSISIAICAAIIVCLLGAGWQNIMWPFQIGMMGAVSAGLWAVYEATKETVSAKKVTVLTLVSLLCAGGGVVSFSVVVAIVLYRRLWAILKPMFIVGMIYSLWYLKYGVSQSVEGNLAKTPRYIYDSAISSASGIGANSQGFGTLLLVLLLLLFVVSMFKKSSFLEGAAFLLMAILTWTVTGLSRAHLQEPAASRYIYVGSILLISSLVSLVPKGSAKYVLAPLAVVSIFLVQDNVKILDQGIGGLRDVSVHIKSSLGGLQLINGPLNAGQSLDSARAPQLDSERYRKISQQFGLVGFSVEELQSQPEEIRLQVDQVLYRLMDELYLKIDKADCESTSEKGVSEIEIKPSETVNVAVSEDVVATFRWFTDGISTSSQLKMKSGDTYQFTNRVVAESPPLEIYFSGRKVDLCG